MQEKHSDRGVTQAVTKASAAVTPARKGGKAWQPHYSQRIWVDHADWAPVEGRYPLAVEIIGWTKDRPVDEPMPLHYGADLIKRAVEVAGRALRLLPNSGARLGHGACAFGQFVASEDIVKVLTAREITIMDEVLGWILKLSQEEDRAIVLAKMGGASLSKIGQHLKDPISKQAVDKRLRRIYHEIFDMLLQQPLDMVSPPKNGG